MSDDHAHPGGHDDLESERDFLLRSPDDLDAERTAGNIDTDTYRVLHDDYTARASAVIQSIADGVERPSPEGPRAPTAMRVVTFGGIFVFAVIAAFYPIGNGALPASDVRANLLNSSTNVGDRVIQFVLDGLHSRDVL